MVIFRFCIACLFYFICALQVYGLLLNLIFSLFFNKGLLYVVFLYGFMSIKGIIHNISALYIVLKMYLIFKC